MVEGAAGQHQQRQSGLDGHAGGRVDRAVASADGQDLGPRRSLPQGLRQVAAGGQRHDPRPGQVPRHLVHQAGSPPAAGMRVDHRDHAFPCDRGGCGSERGSMTRTGSGVRVGANRSTVPPTAAPSAAPARTSLG